MPSPDARQLGQQTLDVLGLAEQLVAVLRHKNLQITTMESCTGGMLANLITSIPGSSEIITTAAITYANDAKVAHGVSATVIGRYSVYSLETAEAMAQASIHNKPRTVGVGVTGSLSRVDPDNASHSVPGDVYIGFAYGDNVETHKMRVATPHRYEAKLVIVGQLIPILHTFIEKYVTLE